MCGRVVNDVNPATNKTNEEKVLTFSFFLFIYKYILNKILYGWIGQLKNISPATITMKDSSK